MKKVKSLMISLFSIAILFSFNPCVNAEEVKTMTVKREAVMESYIGDDNAFTSYITTDGTIVYCMDLDKPGATTGTVYNYSKAGDAGLLYLIQNGYPNKKITNRNEIDRYITQSAIWWYLSDTGQTAKMSTKFQTTDKEAYEGIRDHIKKLVNGAKAAKQSTFNINLQNNSNQLNLSDDEKYYDSELLSVSLLGATKYTVVVSNAPQGTIITDESGTAKNEFNSNEKFKVRVPSSGLTSSSNISVKVLADGQPRAAVYIPTDASFQKVVSTKLVTESVEDTINLSLTPTEQTPGEEVVVPNTAANVPLVILGVGLFLIITGFGIFWYVDKQKRLKIK